jgi:hypothetical protein
LPVAFGSPFPFTVKTAHTLKMSKSAPQTIVNNQ